MQRQGTGAAKGPDSERVLVAGAYLAHHRHVQNGRRTSTSCEFCSQGMGAVVKDVKVTLPDKPGVDSDSGSDSEGSTTHPSGDGESTRQYMDYMYGEDERR